MTITKKIQKILFHNSVFAHNLINRDKWIAKQASMLSSGSRVLDVGAGSCPYRLYFKHCEYLSQDFTGLKSNQLRNGSYGKIDYICDAKSIPVEDSSFDAVLCTEMIEHVPEPEAVLKEIARILRPEGKLILTAPLGSGIHQEPYHFYGGFTPYWYQHFLEKVGFRLINIDPNEGTLKFFSQEALRFTIFTRPFYKLPFIVSMIWLPVWILLIPIMWAIIPLSCHLLDRYDDEKHFTIGYHVTAIKN